MTIKNQPVDVGTSGASRKIALTAGSLSALAMLPGSALAALVTFTGPIGVGLGSPSSVIWDIDGDNSGEFSLARNNLIASFSATATWNLVPIGSNVGARGPVFASNNVGLVLDNPTGQRLLSIRTTYSSSVNVVPLSGYVLGNNFLGFEFDSTDGQHYGWAKLNIGASGVEMTEWTYKNVADEPVHVRAVPEPSSLALLALGAGGLAALRSRKRKQPRSSV